VHALVEAVKKHTHMDRAPEVESIALGEHLAGTLTLVGSKARTRSVQLELSVERDLPDVEGLVGDLNHVWINLVDNAIDAVGEGGRVTVAARREGDAVVVSVTDDGPGIASADQERIFDPFFTTKGVGEGAGLGLHVVRTILEAHKGSVHVASSPGRTCFSVRLPVSGAA
jgi:signal transduction histidine kinase